MRHIGHILVLAYSGLALIFQYFPAMATSTGIKESGPWIIAMIVAVLFGLAAVFKLGKGVIASWSNDDVSLDEFDVPDTMLFGTFMAFIAVNLIAHGILAALSDVGGSIWFGTWAMADVIILIISWVIFKVSAKRQLQAQSRRPRSVDAA